MRLASLALATLLAAPSAAQCQLEKITASNATSQDDFGGSLAVDGNWAIVGAHNYYDSGTDWGAVYFLERTATGWEERQVIHSGEVDDTFFGFSVGLDGDVAVVGAPLDDQAAVNGGAVYFYERTGSTWNFVNKVVASNVGHGDWFGWDVAISGNRSLVCSAGHGHAYVFERGLTVWQERAKLIPAQWNGTSGHTGDIDGDTVFLGFDQYDVTAFSSGAIAIYERQLDGGWLQVDWVTPPGTAAYDWFGREVAIDGDRAVVSAPGDNTVTGPGTGSAFVYERIGGTWTQMAKLVPSDAADFARMGESIDLRGDEVLAGAPYDEVLGEGRGAAYVFSRSDDGWFQRPRLLADDGAHNTFLGRSAVIGEGFVLVGNPSDHGVALGAGAVYAFSNPEFARPFCTCHTGAPCMNGGRREGCLNSTGWSALLSACGSPSVAADDLTLTVQRMAPLQTGLVFYGPGAVAQPFGDGRLCVGSGGIGLFRFLPRTADATGAFTEGPGIVAAAGAIGPGSDLLAGSTWNWQAWYRDPAGPCGSGFNLSNALAITFEP